MSNKKKSATLSGWSPTPNSLYGLARELGLDRNEIALINFVSRHQQSLNDMPYPKIGTVARDMGVGEATIKRWKTALIQKGYLISTVAKHPKHGGWVTCFWDFSPLWEKLASMVPGTQITMWPNRKGDLGKVSSKKAKKTRSLNDTPSSPVSYPGSSPMSHPPSSPMSYPGSSPVSYLKEEQVEEKNSKEDNYCGEASLRSASGPTGEAPDFSGSKKQVPLESVIGQIEEIIRPESGDDMGNINDDPKIKALIEQRKAKSKEERDAQEARRRKRQIAQENLEGKPKGPKLSKILARLEAVWTEAMEQAFPDTAVGKWGGMEKGQAKMLLEAFPQQNGLLIANTIKYVVGNWPSINAKIFKGSAKYPSVGMILKLKQTLVLEAQDYAKIREIIEQRDAYFKENPYTLSLPQELETQVVEAEKIMKSLGLK